MKKRVIPEIPPNLSFPKVVVGNLAVSQQPDPRPCGPPKTRGWQNKRENKREWQVVGTASSRAGREKGYARIEKNPRLCRRGMFMNTLTEHPGLQPGDEWKSRHKKTEFSSYLLVAGKIKRSWDFEEEETPGFSPGSSFMAYNTMPCARAARIIGLLFGADMDIWRVGGLVRIPGGACRDSPPLVLGLLRDRARISEAGARGGRTGPGSGTVGGKDPLPS